MKCYFLWSHESLPDIREVKARHYWQNMSTFIPTFLFVIFPFQCSNFCSANYILNNIMRHLTLKTYT